jgi:hypothetical protein
MAHQAAYLVDQVIPSVPLRHFVLTFPHPLRYVLAYDAELCGAVTHVAVQCIFSWMKHRAKDCCALRRVAQAHCGAVTAVHRARSDLRASIHLHNVVVDGVYVQPDPSAPPQFRALPPPDTVDLHDIAAHIRSRVGALLERRGIDLGGGAGEDPVAAQEPLFAQACADSMHDIVTMGPRRGKRLLKLGALAIPRDLTDLAGGERRAAVVGGFNLHASTRVSAADARGRERLLRYILRPPIARERLTWTEDGRVRYRLKRRFDDGTHSVVYDSRDFVAKLVPLIPRPRFNEIRYFGLLAPAAKLRPQILPEVELLPVRPKQLALFTSTPKRHVRSRSARGRLSFSDLMKRTFEIDIERCELCGRGPMRLVGIVTDPDAIDALLATVCTGDDAQSPLARARAPPPPHYGQLSLPITR